MTYNATAYKKRADGTVFSVEAVEVDADGRVIRACGLWSPYNGTDRYEAIWEESQFSEVVDIHIEHDGGAGYRNRLASLIV